MMTAAGSGHHAIYIATWWSRGGLFCVLVLSSAKEKAPVSGAATPGG